MKNIKSMKNTCRGKRVCENPLAIWSTWSGSKLRTMAALTPFLYYWMESKTNLAKAIFSQNASDHTTLSKESYWMCQEKDLASSPSQSCTSSTLTSDLQWPK